MKFQSARLRVVMVCVIVLCAYWAMSAAVLDRRLQGQGTLFFLVMASIVISSAILIAPRRLVTWGLWGVLCPIAASAVAYGVVLVMFYFQHGSLGPNLSVGSWLLIAFVSPYLGCNIWTLSVALPILGLATSLMRPAAEN